MPWIWQYLNFSMILFLTAWPKDRMGSPAITWHHVKTAEFGAQPLSDRIRNLPFNNTPWWFLYTWSFEELLFSHNFCPASQSKGCSSPPNSGNTNPSLVTSSSAIVMVYHCHLSWGSCFQFFVDSFYPVHTSIHSSFPKVSLEPQQWCLWFPCMDLIDHLLMSGLGGGESWQNASSIWFFLRSLNCESITFHSSTRHTYSLALDWVTQNACSYRLVSLPVFVTSKSPQNYSL